MKIKVIIPNSSTEFRDLQITERQNAAGPGTEVEVVCLPRGPLSIEAAYDEALAAPYIIREVERAEQEGYDAVSIDCAMDTVLRAAREAVRIPVTGAGQSGYLLAMGLCTRFSVITVLKSTADAIKENIVRYRFTDRVASVRFARVPVLELKNEKQAHEAILKEARQAMDQDGAEAIVLGCTGMAKLAKGLSRELKVPVVDPGAAALKLAEVYVSMGLDSSSIAYPPPPLKE